MRRVLLASSFALTLSFAACTGQKGADPLDFSKPASPAAATTTTTTATTTKPAAAKAGQRAWEGLETKPVPLSQRRQHVPPSHPAPLGMNLSSIRDYSHEQPFVDLFKQSRAWISSTESEWDDKREVAVDDNGWVMSLLPSQRARSLVIWGDAPYMFGPYQVEWKGTGTIDFWPQEGTASSTGEGKYELMADPKKGGIAITITKTDPKDPIRDIHVYLPRSDNTRTWNPAFLEVIKPFSTLRVMDWLETNNSTLKSKDKRPKTTNARYSDHGVPAEVIADLANQTGKDIWLNVGHQWDDALVDDVATALRDKIDPKRRIYVEFSNEVWNGMFTQAKAMSDLGLQQKLDEDAFAAGMKAHAERSAAVHKRFDDVFGVRKNQIVRVLGAWAANGWSTGVMLEHLKKKNLEIDAVAIAPYFGVNLGLPEKRGTLQGMAQKDLMYALDGEIDEAIGWTRDIVGAATKHNVAVIAYEGGQHLVGVGPVQDDEHINKLFDRANSHPEMKDLYLRYLAGWKHAGGGLFMHFTTVAPPSRFGRWGALERLSQDRKDAPKFDALLTFLEKTPTWF